MAEAPISMRDASGIADSYLGETLSVVVVGASGALANEKTYPALYQLFKRGLLPSATKIYGYARSAKTDRQLRASIRPHLEKQDKADGIGDAKSIDAFLKLCTYRRGAYDSVESMGGLAKQMTQDERKAGNETANRLFYFAVPSVVYVDIATSIRKCAVARDDGWTRLVLEKPFGHDKDTSAALTRDLSQLFDETSLYRIDHYLGMEMVQNLLVMRFANSIFEPLWNRNHIAAVYLTYKDTTTISSTQGEDHGIIRDVVQDHLMQVVSLIAMEAPASMDEGTAVGNEKVKLLRAISPVSPDNVVLGQYVASADGGQPGYIDAGGAGTSPTFATMVLYIDNPRWQGVPFIIKAGCGMDQDKVDVRLQFKDVPGAGHMFQRKECPRNEIAIRLTPNESVFIRTNIKAPGMSTVPVQSELDLTYRDRYGKAFLQQPNTYTRMLLNVLRGNQSTFVGGEELQRTWEIFTPLLAEVEGGALPMHSYACGSRGPGVSDDLAVKVGYDASTIKRRLAAGPRDNRESGGGQTARELKVYVAEPSNECESEEYALPDAFE